ncbi:MAG: hypothetical protein ACI8RZ_005432 [Myxococcota bacterium]|jgi:hypothetical protein
MRTLLLLTTMILGACDSDVGVFDIGGDDSGMTAPGGEMGGEGGEMPEPESCSADDDCGESCPPDAAECVCYEDTCAVACESDDDCPDTPDGEVIACDDGIGVCDLPEGMPGE